MKTKFRMMLLVLVLLLCLPLPAFAAETYHVVDQAELFSTIEHDELENLAGEISGEYNIDIVILTVESLDGKSIIAYADDYYDYNNYSEDGILFILAMEEREWHISTSGNTIYKFTDSQLNSLGSETASYFSDGDYFDGFCYWLEELPYYLDAEVSDADFALGLGIIFLISLAIGAVVAGIVLLIMRSAMNTKRPQRSAGQYLKTGSFDLRVHQDLFLYSQVTKTVRQQNSSGSGTSVHRGSSGRSHGGSGGKF